MSIPVVLGYFPIAVAFGVAATRAGLSPAEAVMFSVVIFAGAAQFLALTLVTSGAPLVLTAVTLIVMNLRHVIYGPVLLEKAGRHAGARHAWAWAWCLTDEVFATTLGALMRGRRFSERLVGGIGLGAYLAWIAGTAVGVLAGESAFEAWPVLDAALGFMLPSLFLALLLSFLDKTQLLTVAAAALATVLGTFLVSPSVGILAGMILGAAIGALKRASQ
ncbi:MAG: AzlC family ABC transporter permease [Alphaproteobacteria bacterium]|nr:AzlC family ABC transporter permease [Alphaproteobacteria bacterium]